MKTIYVDNNATSAVAPQVFEKMKPFLTDKYGNPSSMHTFGGQVAKYLTEAREHIAALIGAEPDEIIITSCGTESDNTALISTLESNHFKKHIITTRVEHPAVLNTCKFLAKKGYRVTFLPVDSKGSLNLDDLQGALDEDMAIVSVMYANNETGVIFPIEEIGRIVKERDVVFHSDAVQAVGKLPLNMKNSTLDMLSLSGHKIHAPKGVGALYIRKGTKFTPFMQGGHQEHGRRGGTENVAAIVGLGEAARLALRNMEEENSRVKALRDKLQAGVLENASDVQVNGDVDNRLPNTLNVGFEYIEGEAILLLLNELNIAASSGSACTSGSLEPSHVLRAMGVPFTSVHGSIRFSLSRYNTEEEIDYIIRELPPIINRLRGISPYGSERPVSSSRS